MNRYHFTDEQRKLLEGLSQPFAIYQFIDKRVVTLILSDGFCKVFGYDDRALAYYDMDNDMYKDVYPDDVARIADAAFRFATEGGTYEVVYRTRMQGGDYRIIHAMGEHVYKDEGVCLAHVWYTDEGVYTASGENERSRLNRAFNNTLHEESLTRASYYDFLTGLPNMTYFFDLVEEGKRTMLERGGNPALLYLNLDGMKFFNAQNSFAAGDRLLREFACVLKRTFSSEGCCRIGSDHFAAFTEEAGLEDTLEQFFQDCRHLNDGNTLPVRVGIYLGRLEDVPVSTACDRAKLACDSLKDTYVSSFGYFDSSMSDKVRRRRHVLENLDRAIDKQWIQVYYQPIIRAVNGKVCDEEALSRWFDPIYGLLSPAEFIPVLEETGVIYKLDLYVLEQALRHMERRRDEGIGFVPCSINLSRSDFVACDIVEEIRKRVDASGIGRGNITIEITESTIGGDVEFMKKQVKRFHDLGFPVWMDDFGSGYSSIDLLQSMDFDLIKFDMSFMRQLDEGKGGRIVLTELVKMTTSLGAEALCEGVETEDQVRFLREIGCMRLQGFYFSKAISFGEIVARHKRGPDFGYENPDESAYYEAIGAVNLYDLTMMTNGDDECQRYASTLPMCVIETDGANMEFVRTNQPYRNFMDCHFGLDLDKARNIYKVPPSGAGAAFMRKVWQCCEKGGRAFFDGVLPDGPKVHAFIRCLGVNPVTHKSAAATAVLSVSE